MGATMNPGLHGSLQRQGHDVEKITQDLEACHLL